ncbi:MAG: hypothetical protein ACXABY_02700 [Candidatus Thorarchaeota archaeon]|jgi:hypothetical protein
MALNLVIGNKYKYDGSEIKIIDVTQTENDDPTGKWGDSGNPSRADKCLLSFTKYTDDVSAESYTKYEDQYIGTFEELSVSPGAGLLDDYQSVFTLVAVGDGHYSYYVLAIDQFDNNNIPVAPTAGDLYYNTDTLMVYIYTTVWTEVNSTDHFATMETFADKVVCEVLVPTLLLIEKQSRTHDWEECLLSRDCESDDKFYDLQYLRSRLEGAQGDFYGGMKPTARKTMKQLTDKFC